MVAVTDIEVYLTCVEILMRDRNLDGLIALGALPERVVSFLKKPALKKATGVDDSLIERTENMVLKASEKIMEGIIYLMKELKKPVVMVGGRQQSQKLNALMDREGIHLYPTPERAVRVMARVMEYAAFRRRAERQESREGG
jgi:acyl-CoA synthetase (NDP forming)